jgi:hypothetical protein
VTSSLTWDPKCTWKVTGHVCGPYGKHLGSLQIKAPDPDMALHIAAKNHLMIEIVRIEHVSGRPGCVS